jgi:acyl carrier protein
MFCIIKDMQRVLGYICKEEQEMREEILAKIIERGAPLWGADAASLNENTTFEEMNAKSVHYSQITTFLEDEYDVEIPFMNFRRKKTLGEAADYVLELVEE